jgi:hypothetical protein
MSGAKFQATITANDSASETLARIGGQVDGLVKKMGGLHQAEGKAAAHGLWGRATHALHGFGEVAEHVLEPIKGIAERLAEMIPPLAALGSLGAITGLFELTAKVAENFGNLQHAAKGIGIAADELERLRFLAKMTDTDVGSLETGMRKFAATVGAAALGRDKPVAQIFKQLGISLRDGKGHVREIGDIMKDVFKAFEVNQNPATRDYLARTLFGRGGIDLIEMLTMSKDRLKELFDQFDKIHTTLSSEDQENLENYKDSWKELGVAVEELVKSVGASLSPVLLPVVNAFRDWVASNKDLISAKLTHWIEELIETVKGADWDALWDNMKRGLGGVWQAIEHTSNAINGIADAYAALKNLVQNPASALPSEEQLEYFRNQGAGVGTMPPGFPTLPNFGIPGGGLATPAQPNTMLPGRGILHSGFGLPPVTGHITIDINGAPAGTTATVTQQGDVALRPRVNGDSGAGFGWGSR